MQQAYVCVYRQRIVTRPDWRKTVAATITDDRLARFLDRYENSFYDWGDDPSFYCATELLGEANSATWGVCRRDVRATLKKDDMVVFFCARPRRQTPKIIDYHYIGVATVKDTVSRPEIWTQPQLAIYRHFYNVLAELKDNVLVQKETFHPYHDDWRDRAEAAYILFDPEPDATHFNLISPKLVATYNGSDIPEEWNETSRDLEDLLFSERGITRRLRTSQTGFANTKINLVTIGKTLRDGRSVDDLRNALLLISRQIARA
jgi:hypothetical protein